MADDDGSGGSDEGEVVAWGNGWKGGGSEREWGGGLRKVVISRLLINIPRLRAFQRNVIN